jgi:hypothetical protein
MGALSKSDSEKRVQWVELDWTEKYEIKSRREQWKTIYLMRWFS